MIHIDLFVLIIFLRFRAILAAFLFFGEVFTHVECLNVTCSNQIGLLPFRRINTCYIKRIERPLERGEQLNFHLSYAALDKIKTLDISIANPDQPSLGIGRIPIEAFTWFPNLQSLRKNSHVASV